MNVYVVIPYFSDGIEIKSNEVMVFNTREAAYQYAVKERFTRYDIIASQYVAFQGQSGLNTYIHVIKIII